MATPSNPQSSGPAALRALPLGVTSKQRRNPYAMDVELLIEALSDTLSEEDIPVTREEGPLLDARLGDLEANPEDQSPWEEVRARLEQRLR